jgi:hypothetical protein
MNALPHSGGYWTREQVVMKMQLVADGKLSQCQTAWDLNVSARILEDHCLQYNIAFRNRPDICEDLEAAVKMSHVLEKLGCTTTEKKPILPGFDFSQRVSFDFVEKIFAKHRFSAFERKQKEKKYRCGYEAKYVCAHRWLRTKDDGTEDISWQNIHRDGAFVAEASTSANESVLALWNDNRESFNLISIGYRKGTISGTSHRFL